MPHAGAATFRILIALVAVTACVASATPLASAADAKPAAKKASPAKKKPAAQKPVTAKEAIKAMVEGEDVRDFRTFCDTWMGKLKDRTTYNTAHIPWTKGGPGVVGEYISYGTDRTCIAREEPGKDPIGKITYREIKYRKEGPTETAAMGSAGTIVEQTDVTEIFRFGKGRWQY
jgi:hypothetical protein